MKLFVWYGILTDYTDGIGFAMANDYEEAIRLCAKGISGDDSGIHFERYVKILRENKCTIYEEPFGTGIYGGG